MILRPTKHSHPDKTVIHVALVLLTRLKSRRVEKFDALKKYVFDKVSGAEVLFLPALNFLFLLGLIEYRQKTDSFEFTGKNEAL